MPNGFRAVTSIGEGEIGPSFQKCTGIGAEIAGSGGTREAIEGAGSLVEGAQAVKVVVFQQERCPMVLELSQAAYAEISARLKAAGFSPNTVPTVFRSDADAGEIIDMHDFVVAPTGRKLPDAAPIN